MLSRAGVPLSRSAGEGPGEGAHRGSAPRISPSGPSSGSKMNGSVFTGAPTRLAGVPGLQPRDSLEPVQRRGHRVGQHGEDAALIGLVRLAPNESRLLQLADLVAILKVADDPERLVFGKPVASFQNTKFELAACQAEVDARRRSVSSNPVTVLASPISPRSNGGTRALTGPAPRSRRWSVR